MTEIRLYDTMAREKRVFTPADPGRVTMYVCGPTVYSRAHIGNARPAVVFDVLARLLRHLYPDRDLQYARNVTDVDDKIIEAADAEGVNPSIITQRYERYYDKDMGALGVEKPRLTPHATQNISDMTSLIERLIEAGNAYEADGHVLFHVPSDPEYGTLSQRDRAAMIAGARVEVASYKRDPADFVLWKPSPRDVIGWESPWGYGRPGWHIECSAMIAAHLGETIDIHAGGLDLIFPHHENELAQSRCAHGGAPLARHWVHNGFLSMAHGEKMSKSLGNIVTVEDLIASGRDGLQLRYALLMGHYRQPLEWSDRLVSQAQRTLDNLRHGLSRGFHGLGRLPNYDRPPHPTVVEALSDDLNTPDALSALAALAKANEWESVVASSRLLGFSDYLIEPKKASGTYDGETLEYWVGLRSQLKRERDFIEADKIRARLKRYKVSLEDQSDGSTQVLFD